jgi:hypothetical protein
MIVQTLEVPGVTSGQTFINGSDCWEYLGYYTTPYHEPSGYIRTDFSGNYFGTPDESNVFSDCTECLSSGNRFTTPTSTPTTTPSVTLSPTTTPSITVSPSITPTPSTTPAQNVNLDFDVVYESGSTKATFTVIASSAVQNSLRVKFTNVLFDNIAQRDVKFNPVTVEIRAGEISGSTSATTSTDYSRIEAYQTSYSAITTTGTDIRVNTINKYHSVNFIGKTSPVTSFYQFSDCCGTGGTKNLEVDRNSTWIIEGYGVIIDGVCYIPRGLGGDGSDGLYYGPDFKDCSFVECPTCPSPTPSVTSSVTPSITPTVTPSNPYYLVCDVITREYTLVCDVDTQEYTLSCDSIFASPSSTPTPTNTPSISLSVTPSNIAASVTPTATPTTTVTPTVTPSLTIGDKTIYVYYPNI